MLSISVGYAGINYTHEDEYDRCDVVAVSPSDDMDIAILQLNKKRTPDIVKFVFSPENFFTGTLEPQKDKLMWIGYPRGNMMARDQITHSIEPQIRKHSLLKGSEQILILSSRANHLEEPVAHPSSMPKHSSS